VTGVEAGLVCKEGGVVCNTPVEADLACNVGVAGHVTVDVAVKVAVTCCSDSTGKNQLGPGSGSDGTSNGSAGITDDDKSRM